MVGQIFRPEDIEVEPLQDIEASSSGVCRKSSRCICKEYISSLVLGINEGCERLEQVRQMAWLNEYSMEGQMGVETLDNKITGRIITKATFGE